MGKKIIEDVNFEGFYNEYTKVCGTTHNQEDWSNHLKSSDWLKNNGIKSSAYWIFPQLLALYAKHTPPKLDNGQIDSANYFKSTMDLLDPWNRGLILFTLINLRGLVLKDQYKSPNKEFCGLVPLVMAAHKKYNSIPYSRWSRDGLNKIVPKDLCEAMLFTDIPQLPKEELLEARNNGLIIRSGLKEGSHRSPISSHRVYNVENVEVQRLPKLVQVILLQIWCAHPLNRNEYMILDPLNWDNTPEPLEDSSIFAKEVDVTTSKKCDNFDELDIPWA